MNPKTRLPLLLLPLAQMGLAAFLTIHNFFLSRPHSVDFARWENPDRQVCDAINAPAAVARYFIIAVVNEFSGYYVYMFCETAVYFALVGLLWYVFIIELRGRNRDRRLWSARTMLDLFGLVLGAVTIISGFVVRHQFGAITTYSTLPALAYWLWGVVILVFYAMDFRRAWGYAARATGRLA